MSNLEIFAGWRQQQQESKYPFADDCTCTSKSGYTIDNGVFVDASVAFADSSQVIRIVSISQLSGVITISLQNKTLTETGTATFTAATLTDELVVRDAAGRRLGLLVVNTAKASELLTDINGTETFADDALLLCPRCIHVYASEIVTGIAAEGETPVRGHVLLIGENGVVLRHVQSESAELEGVTSSGPANYIRVDVVGDPLANAATCLEDGDSAIFPETLSGVSPDRFGNIQIVPDRSTIGTALRIISNASQSEIVIELAGVAP